MRDEDRLKDTTKNEAPYPRKTLPFGLLIAIIGLVLAGLIFGLWYLLTNGNL